MDDKIQFFYVDPETLEVSLENSMSNYMNCNFMYYGPKVKYCITYQNGGKKIQIFRRKVYHNFKVSVEESNLEGAKGIEYKSMGIILVSHIDKLYVYDKSTYRRIGRVMVKLLDSE